MSDALSELSRSSKMLNGEEQRKSWPETWMSIARLIAASRSYDKRLKVCALVVPEDNTGILALGYNGNYKGGPHEPESDEPGMSGYTHAEVNALIKLDFNFPKRKHMYVTHSPCRACSKLIVNAGISMVVYDVQYRDTSGLDILKRSKVEVYSFDELKSMMSSDGNS